MFAPFVFCTLQVVLVVIACATGFELKITPQRAHITAGTWLKVMCLADVPLAGCQFKRTFQSTIYDLSRGPLTPNGTDYEYYGTDLSAGECGIYLKEYVKEHQYDLVGCRVREETGPWKYASMAVIINANESYQFNFSPEEVVVSRGNNVSILCRADQPLSSCFFKWPGLDSPVGVNNTLRTAKYRYFGLGLEKGHCGITLFSVTSVMSGDVYCSAWTKMRPKGYESDTTALIVATAPGPPQLYLNQTVYTAGDTLRATCVVRNSRPVSNITWFLDSVTIRSDAVNEAPLETAWVWRHSLQTIAQNLLRTVTWLDHGKELRCQGSHFSLTWGKLTARVLLNVKYAPRDIQQPIRLPGYDIGESAEILLKVYANPQPVFTWKIGNQSIGELDSIEDGRIQAPRGTKNAKLWEARLIVSSLKLSDFGSDIFLTAKNEIGKMSYRIVLVGPRTPQTLPPTSTAQDSATTDSAQSPSSDQAVDFTTTTDEIYKAVTDETTSHQFPEDAVATTGAEEPTVKSSSMAKNKNANSNAQVQSDGRQSFSPTGLVLGLLAVLVILGSVMLVLYARATSRWCFVRQQFASEQMHSPFASREDEDSSSMQINL